jgi:hypothetical protein
MLGAGTSHIRYRSKRSQVGRFRTITTAPRNPADRKGKLNCGHAPHTAQVDQYCLSRDVAAAQRRPHSPGTEFLSPPLVVLNNMQALSPFSLSVPTVSEPLIPSFSSIPSLSPPSLLLSLSVICLWSVTASVPASVSVHGCILVRECVRVCVRSCARAQSYTCVRACTRA